MKITRTIKQKEMNIYESQDSYDKVLAFFCITYIESKLVYRTNTQNGKNNDSPHRIQILVIKRLYKPTLPLLSVIKQLFIDTF